LEPNFTTIPEDRHLQVLQRQIVYLREITTQEFG